MKYLVSSLFAVFSIFITQGQPWLPEAGGTITGNLTINGTLGIGIPASTATWNKIHILDGSVTASYTWGGFTQLWCDNALIWKKGTVHNGLRFGTATGISAEDWSQQMIITDDGRLGLGTLVPEKNLHIQGAGSTTIRLFSNNDNNNAYYTDITNNYNSNEAFKISNHGFNIIRSSLDAYGFIELGNASNLNINFQTSSSGKVTIPDGIVGIGNVGSIVSANTDPNAKLFVNGNMVIKKIKVTQTGWADYVFDSTYSLMPLSNVAKFIHLNKHLPEVPSANVVESAGVDLGDTQVLLLKKIEELTLYIIQQDKRINALEEKLKK